MNLAGTSLGPYRLVREIGRGGMAVVYLGTHPDQEQPVAIKVLQTGLHSDPSFVERFQREARLAARLEHPNIIRIFAVGREGDLLFLVMEYVDGGTLAQRLAPGRPLPWPVVVAVVDQVAQALDHAHSRGIIHRDVKPSNILLTQGPWPGAGGRAILTDLGVAVALAQTRLTLSGGQWGTPTYMAPEQSLGRQVSPATDIYALGVVAYEMATGRVPFSAETPVAQMHQHVFEPPPPPRQVNPSLSRRGEQAILQALAKDPVARFGSASAFAHALRDREAAVPHPEPLPRRAPAWAWGLVCLLVLALAFGLALSANRGTMPVEASLAWATGQSSTVIASVEPSITEAGLMPTPSVHVLRSAPAPSGPAATPSPMPTANPLWQAVQEAVNRYDQVKALAIGRSHDDSFVTTILVGAALDEIRRAVRWQAANGAYYVLDVHWNRVEWVQQTDTTHLRALVTKNETSLYYPEGWSTPSARQSRYADEYQVLLGLLWQNGQWYIEEKDVQD